MVLSLIVVGSGAQNKEARFSCYTFSRSEIKEAYSSVDEDFSRNIFLHISGTPRFFESREGSVRYIDH